MNRLARMEFVGVTLNRLLKEIDPDILSVGYQYINNVETVKILYRRKINIEVLVTGLNEAELSMEVIRCVSNGYRQINGRTE